MKTTKSHFSNPKRANELNGSEWTKFSISVWNDIRKTPDEAKLHHPGAFPEMLAARLIRCLTTVNDKVVLDPFMGSGSTLVAAMHLGKQGVGFELNQKFIKIAQQRLGQESLFVDCLGPKIYNEDARIIADTLQEESVHFCLTSPPYWDVLSQKRSADKKEIRNYGNHEADLAQIRDYDEFITALSEIFSGVFKVLVPEKYFVVNVMDLRKLDKFYPLHSDIAYEMRKIGFIFDDLIIWDRRQEYNNLRSLGYPYVFRLNKIHEYLLMFQKPKSKVVETREKAK